MISRLIWSIAVIASVVLFTLKLSGAMPMPWWHALSPLLAALAWEVILVTLIGIAVVLAAHASKTKNE